MQNILQDLRSWLVMSPRGGRRRWTRWSHYELNDLGRISIVCKEGTTTGDTGITGIRQVEK